VVKVFAHDNLIKSHHESVDVLSSPSELGGDELEELIEATTPGTTPDSMLHLVPGDGPTSSVGAETRFRRIMDEPERASEIEMESRPLFMAREPSYENYYRAILAPLDNWDACRKVKGILNGDAPEVSA
jgi:hypothetical protein